MTDEWLLGVLAEASSAVAATLEGRREGLTGAREGQYGLDVAADEAAVAVLSAAGLGVVSEESGLHHPERPVRVVLDPVDGSTNAHRGLPWYATSLCALDEEGPRAALVDDHASRRRYRAVRGGGATVDGRPVRPSGATGLEGTVVAVTGVPGPARPWWQHRFLGAVALDLCAVADGRLDAYVDCSPAGHAPWDYLGALLVCREAGVAAIDRHGRELAPGGGDRRHGRELAPGGGDRRHVSAGGGGRHVSAGGGDRRDVSAGGGDRRHVLAAATPELLARLAAELGIAPAAGASET